MLVKKQTFSIINRAPQEALFNRYEWRCIEIAVRDSAPHIMGEYDTNSGGTPGNIPPEVFQFNTCPTVKDLPAVCYTYPHFLYLTFLVRF